MKKPIPRPLHGIADYAYVPAVAAAPEMVGFSEEKVAANLCRAISAGVLGSTLFTRAEWGLVRIIPYKTHLALDLALGAFSVAAPWLFGFAKNTKARNTFLTMGITALVAGSLSRVEEMPEDAQIFPV